MIPILDSGHGRVINGLYQTPGKRSPEWEKGVLYEGMFNKWVTNRILEELDRRGVPYYYISPEHTDISLDLRVDRANKIYRDNTNTYLLSIHANAGEGTGIEGFTSPGQTKSDAIADMFLSRLERKMNMKMRYDLSDGDKDKEANFQILRYTHCPAFLLECGFMDHKKDYHNLWDRSYLSLLVDTLVETIVELYNK